MFGDEISEGCCDKGTSFENDDVSCLPNDKASPKINIVAKWGKKKVHLPDLSETTTIAQVKEILSEKTGVLPKRQKLIGLSLKNKNNRSSVGDDSCLRDVQTKMGSKSKSDKNVVEHSFILMGTPEDKIFVDPGEKIDLPDVVDDFDLDFCAGSTEVSVVTHLGPSLIVQNVLP